MSDALAVSKAERIARTLEAEIRSGAIPHGDRLDSENRLMRRFAVSRNTVRRGLEALARQGLIATRSGVGSFVVYDGARINDALGWTLALSQGEGQVETRPLRLDRGPCAEVAGDVGVADDFLRIDRLRLWSAPDGTRRAAISLERSRLPWREGFAGVLAGGLVEGSLSRTLTGLGIVVQGGQEWAGVLPALPEAEAAVMGRRAGEPMLHLRRLTRDAAGAVIEHVESLLDPARFALRLEF